MDTPNIRRAAARAVRATLEGMVILVIIAVFAAGAEAAVQLLHRATV